MPDAALTPRLERRELDGIAVWLDPDLAARGTLVAFTERVGGVSAAPYDLLDLAPHVGDDPLAVDENRRRLLHALGLAHLVSRVVTADQVHGSSIATVTEEDAGRGAFASGADTRFSGTDALVTSTADIPLMLFFADCVPVVIVAPGAVAVVHAGWRGALASLPGLTARRLACEASVEASSLGAYIGPHIGPCHYPVADGILSQFINTFGTLCRADSGGLDLGHAVTASLIDAGVVPCNIARVATCTAESTDRFFSYRAEGPVTGRHAALAVISHSRFSAR